MPFARMLAGQPHAPTALLRLLADLGSSHGHRSVVEAFARDADSATTFLFVTRRFLPGRRMGSVREAVSLLGDTLSMRLGLLASCTHWMRALLPDDPVTRPLLRHSIATAVACEPLGRESRACDPLFAYAAGLLHHLGDFVLIAGHTGDPVADGHSALSRVHQGARVAAGLLQSAGVPPALPRALLEHEEVRSGCVSGAAPVAMLLAAADHAVTHFGYAAPLGCATPAVDPEIERAAEPLMRQRQRVCASIEDALAAVFDVEARAARAISHARVVTQAVHGGGAEGGDDGSGSARDLGPLPVLFARITDARDVESVEAAFAAGLVEELGAARAWYLRLEKDGSALRGGVLCSRGNVPLPLHDVAVPVAHLPKALRTAFSTGRPIPHQGVLPQVATIVGGADGRDTIYLPVAAARDVFGLLGLELEPDYVLSLDLLSAVATHVGLAMHAAALQKLSQEATTDDLTGLFNRRGILDAFDRALEECRLGQRGIGVALIDCDHLKLVNDNFGHLMGDEFLRRISEIVRGSMRTCDVLGRYGGDEFLAVLPDVDEPSLRLALDRARSQVEQAGLQSNDGLLLSVSIGGVVCEGSTCTREEMLRLADSSLYRAKEVGRNTVDVVVVPRCAPAR